MGAAAPDPESGRDSGSLLSADTDPAWFLRQLGIEKRVVEINGVQWTLTGKILDKIEVDENGTEVLPVDERVLQLIKGESDFQFI